MKKAVFGRRFRLWMATCRRSRLRSFVPVIAVAGGLLVIFPAKQTSAVGKCRQDAAPSIDWSDCKKRMLMLDGSNFDGANLSNADFSMTDLGRSSMKGANVTKAGLVRTSLAQSDLTGADFSKAEGYRSDFTAVKATGASFVAAELQRGNFSSADLRNSDFTKAELGRAIFYRATFENTHFAMANLSRALFHNTSFAGPVDFTDAFMFLTRIEGVDLTRATGLKQEQIALACGDETTKLPQGLTAPAGWPCPDE
ncbi:uncharacterized protein YjbI with pentapeptide repeats [Neorhizobium galegae]|nr:uncharacterized protein YjbI with pentapeptide repeats [Neorhizobium galegae]